MSYMAQELNTKITLSRVTHTQDPNTGYPMETWTPYAEAFAKFEPLLGREYFAAATITSDAQAKVTLRHMDGIDVADRITARGKNWNIQSIQNIQNRNREMLIYVKHNPIADA